MSHTMRTIRGEDSEWEEIDRVAVALGYSDGRGTGFSGLLRDLALRRLRLPLRWRWDTDAYLRRDGLRVEFRGKYWMALLPDGTAYGLWEDNLYERPDAWLEALLTADATFPLED